MFNCTIFRKMVTVVVLYDSLFFLYIGTYDTDYINILLVSCYPHVQNRVGHAKPICGCSIIHFLVEACPLLHGHVMPIFF